MGRSRGRLGGLLQACVLVFAGCFASSALASVEWLLQQTQPDGSVASASDVANPHQSTAEAAVALRLLNVNAPLASADAFVRAHQHRGTEELSRQILVAIARSESTASLVTELLTHQNADGGFGELAGFDSTPLDTGFALYSLYKAGQQRTPQNLAALNYLTSTQTAGGGWAMGSNSPSVYVTAHALRALWQFRQLLPSTVQNGALARQFILGSAQANALWESNFVSATALITLAPMQTVQGELSAHVAALTAQRSANLSWGNDVYTTALALQATFLASSSSANPDLALVRGRLADAQTLAPLAGATITLTSGGVAQRTSNAQGAFEFANLAAGSYTLSVQAAGYPTLTAPIALTAGQTLDLGVLNLLNSGATNVARIEGTVTSTTGATLSGVTVSVQGGASAQTDSLGRYFINNVPAGNVTLTAAQGGFYTAQGSTVLVGGATVNFSPSLRPVVTAGFSISGTFIDAATQQPLSGVSVAISGSATASATSDSTGAVAISNLNPGDVRIGISLTGYAALSLVATVDGGQTLNVSQQLVAIEGGAPATFSIAGHVSDKITHAAVSGAQVAVSGGVTGSAVTDAAGNYSISGLTPGSFSITVSATGYQTANASAAGVAHLGIDFSPELIPADTLPTGLRARIVDANSNANIEGASVVVTHGAGSTTAATDPGGLFLVFGIASGTATVAVNAPGYQQSQLSAAPVAGHVNDLGVIQLLPVTYNAPVTLAGRVLNSVTGQNLAGVSIVATTASGTQSTQSSADGSFTITVGAGQEADLTFVRAGFITSEVTLLATPEAANFGQVRLRPAGLDVLLADFAVLSVDASLVLSSPETYQVSGSVSARVQNRGYANIPAGTPVLAFEDRNRNGVVDGSEIELGRTSLASDMVPEEIRDLLISVSGATTFRDAPVTVLADPTLLVVERDESNNAQSSFGSCVAIPPPASALNPVLKWHWSGSVARPGDNSVFGPTMVGQFSDDNGDGAINERDVPDVVFTTRLHSLNVVSGANGTTIWQSATNVMASFGSPAIGDIDGDGLLEIVGNSPDRTRLRAYEHDGTLKWDQPTSATSDGDVTRNAVTIADLNRDGVPEIITANRVFNNQGVLQWTGSGDGGGTVSYGTIPIAANLDMDGSMEVIMGRKAYRADGTLMWNQTGAQSDGFNAVGNLDNDAFPEIVLMGSARLYVLEHTGAIKWGPVVIPGGGGDGGAPTVGNFDADPEPEIGVAGETRYTVYNHDGSQLWTKTIVDLSARTGSTVFDFDGNGRNEVVYADEHNLRIYNGADGTQLEIIPNESGTTLEYPVVADVDGDGRAEIIIGANNGDAQGVRVFEGGQGEWMPTRAIWNQSAYHVSNINDDGTIPQNEEYSWLTHNTYRANAALPRAQEPTADLTAGALRLIDNGIGHASSLTLRVGNAGSPLTANTATVNFYDGAPSAGGVLLGSVFIPALATGAYTDVRLEQIAAVSPNGTLHAVVDPTARVTECDEGNNSASTPGRPALGGLAISTNQAQYAPGSSVQIQLDVMNTGQFTNDYRVELSVSDSNGALISSLGEFNATALASGASTQFVRAFDSLGLLAGGYQLSGKLFDPAGTLLATTVHGFSIAHDESQGPAVSLRLTTDRATYHTSDLVSIDTLSRNLTVATPIAGARVVLSVTNPQGAALSAHTLELGQLMPGGSRQAQHDLPLAAAGVGVYSVSASLQDGAGQVLATRAGSFEVVSNASLALSGSVTVGTRTLEAGQVQMCTRSVTNRGTTALSGLELRYVVARLSDEATVGSQVVTATIAAGDTYSNVGGVPTSGYAAGDYACAVQARVENEWKDLGYGVFSVTTPTAQADIEATFTRPDRGRLLVLLDEQGMSPCTQVRNLELWAPFPMPLIPSTYVYVKLVHNWGQTIDSEAIELGNYQGTVDANAGSAANLAITGLSANVITVQISNATYLAQDYRLVVRTTADGTPAMILDTEYFDEPCGWPVGEGGRVGDFRVSGGTTASGAALPPLVAPAPSLAAKRAFLEDVLNEQGWSFHIVTNDEEFAEEMRRGRYQHYAIFATQERFPHLVQRELVEIVNEGKSLLDAGYTDQRQSDLAAALGVIPSGKHASSVTQFALNAPWLPSGTITLARSPSPMKALPSGATKVGEFDAPTTKNVALSTYVYGQGKGLFAAYAMLAEATHAGPASTHATILRNTLQQLVVPRGSTKTQEVVTLEVNVDNVGDATEGRVRIPLPTGMTVVDLGGAEVVNGELIWNLALVQGEQRRLTALARVPATAGARNLEAIVESRLGSVFTEQARVPMSITVATRSTATQVLNIAYQNDSYFGPVINWMELAEYWRGIGNLHNTRLCLLEAAGAAGNAQHALAGEVRLMIDDLLFEVGLELAGQ